MKQQKKEKEWQDTKGDWYKTVGSIDGIPTCIPTTKKRGKKKVKTKSLWEKTESVMNRVGAAYRRRMEQLMVECLSSKLPKKK